ncbi:MAG: hypothetical protein J6N45_04815 [Alphaproteobacteria bacterium]|nr:hypothetical protein [Alphaproteobacteria bacterium]
MKKIFLFCLCCFYTFSAQAMKVDTDLINEMLTTLDENYLFEVDNAATVTAGMQILHDLDARFVISKGSDRIYIYHNGKITAIIPFPQDLNDTRTWSKNIVSTLEAAGKMSEKIALRDFELPDLMMKKMTESLDKFSHYYSQFDYREDEGKNAFHTLYADRMIDDVLYLRVRIFNKQTARKIKRSLKEYHNAKAIILDLRGNSGGIFNEALQTADLFTDGEIISFTAGRHNHHKHYYTSDENALYTGPLVILVDGNTASAAEVLAAGLQEQSRAKIIGTRTFGKGTIQNVLQMSNGGKVALTTQQFFTPSGKAIHNKGVTPDICTQYDHHDQCAPQPRTDKQEDITTAVEFLHNNM